MGSARWSRASCSRIPPVRSSRPCPDSSRDDHGVWFFAANHAAARWGWYRHRSRRAVPDRSSPPPRLRRPCGDTRLVTGKTVVISDSMTLCSEDCPLDTANVTVSGRRNKSPPASPHTSCCDTGATTETGWAAERPHSLEATDGNLPSARPDLRMSSARHRHRRSSVAEQVLADRTEHESSDYAASSRSGDDKRCVL